MSLYRSMKRAVRLVTRRYVEVGYTTDTHETANFIQVLVPDLGHTVEIGYTPMTVTVYTRGGDRDHQATRELQYLIDAK